MDNALTLFNNVYIVHYPRLCGGGDAETHEGKICVKFVHLGLAEGVLLRDLDHALRKSI